VFVTVSHFIPILIAESKAGAYPSGAPHRPALPENIRLTVANTPAYYGTDLMTLVKRFMKPVPGIIS
jgi:hypothetical protein